MSPASLRSPSDPVRPGHRRSERPDNVPRPGRRARGAWFAGFTILELLIVLAIVGILAGLLIPSMARSRLRARVVACASHGHQWAIAANLYAGEDPRGRFPSYRQPFSGRNPAAMLYPWMVNHALVTNLGSFGLEPRLWFCPARPREWELASEKFRILSGGRDIVTIDDLSRAFMADSPEYATFGYSWWVPRPVEGFPNPYPSPGEGVSRLQTGWPTRPDDPATAVQPILSDAFYGIWDEDRKRVDYLGAGGLGHRVSTVQSVSSLNVTFGDGRVETRPAAKLQWQLNPGSGSATFMY